MADVPAFVGGFSKGFLVAMARTRLSKSPLSAVVFIVIASLSFSSGKGEAQEYPTTVSPQTQQQPSQSTPPALAQQPAVETPHYEVSCPNPKDHDAADLCEQRRMAQAAEYSNWWACVQTFLGILGFAAVIFTLAYTARGTRAAVKSADLARKAYVAEHRTWVAISPVDIGHLVVKEDGTIRLSLDLMIENTGDRPATNVNVACETYKGRGFAINKETVMRLVEFTKTINSPPLFESGGSTLLRGQKLMEKFTADAKLDPIMEAKTREQEAAGVPPENLKPMISVAYCVIYKSPASDEWFHTASSLVLIRRNGQQFTLRSMRPEHLWFLVIPTTGDVH